MAAVIDAVFSSYRKRMDEWSSARRGTRHAAWRALIVSKLVLVGTGIVGVALVLHGAP